MCERAEESERESDSERAWPVGTAGLFAPHPHSKMCPNVSDRYLRENELALCVSVCQCVPYIE